MTTTHKSTSGWKLGARHSPNGPNPPLRRHAHRSDHYHSGHYAGKCSRHTATRQLQCTDPRNLIMNTALDLLCHLSRQNPDKQAKNTAIYFIILRCFSSAVRRCRPGFDAFIPAALGLGLIGISRRQRLHQPRELLLLGVVGPIISIPSIYIY